MNITIEYTQAERFPGQKIKKKEHIISCHDTNTFPNGQPKPDDVRWTSYIENMDGSGVGAVYTLSDGSTYERIA